MTCLVMKDILKDIGRKDAILRDDRAKILDAIMSLSESKSIPSEADHNLQSDIMAALQMQNDLLRQRAEDLEDESSGLEKETSGLKDQLSSKVKDFDLKSSVIAELKEKNSLLRQKVEDQGDVIVCLEQDIAQLKSRILGTNKGF